MSKKTQTRDGWVFVQNIVIGVLCIGLFMALYTWRLGTLTAGKSIDENKAITSTQYLSQIKDDPAYLPHQLLQYLAHAFGQTGSVWMRACTVIFTFIFLLFFYILAKNWFGRLTALIGTLLLATTPMVVLVSRSASHEVLLLYPIIIIAISTWLYKYKGLTNYLWLLFAASLAVAFYIPGVVWFLIISLAVNYKRLLEVISRTSKLSIIAGFMLFLVLLAPLFFVIITNPSIIRPLLLIPEQLPGVVDFVKNIGWSLSALIFRFPEHIPFTLGRLPILTVAQTVLALVGVYAIWKKARREIYSLIALFVLGIFFAALNSNMVLLLLCLPAVMLFAAAGLRFLYLKWLRIFPLNPIPRTLAFVLVLLLVVAHTAYGVRYVLLAWPQNVETRNTYMLK